mgnify:CR=1 FL=1
MGETWSNTAVQLTEYVPNIVGALAILVVGWIVAALVASGVRRILLHTSFGERLGQWLTGKEGRKRVDIENTASRIVYYLLLVLVFVAFLQALRLTLATEPLNEMLTQVFMYLPNLVGAIILLLAAWVVATIMRLLVLKLADITKLDKRIDREFESEETPVISETLSEVVYWLVIIVFLPAVLGALGLEGILEPVREAVQHALTYLPNVFAAVLVLGAGWIAARVLRRATARLSSSAGVDRVSERVGLQETMGEKPLSQTIGLIVYVLVLIPVLIAALNALKIDSVTEPASNMLNIILQALPAIFAASLILVISYLIARIVSGLVTTGLSGVGFDKLPARVGLWREPQKGEKTPSQIAGWATLLAIMLFAAIEAANVLNFSGVEQLLAQITEIFGAVLFGLAIFLVGVILANAAGSAVARSNIPQNNIATFATKAAILVLTGAVALRQMGIANEIIILGFGLFFGAIAVGMAIAFGVGGRAVAARKLEEWTQAFEQEGKSKGSSSKSSKS